MGATGRSFWLDLKILALSLTVVPLRDVFRARGDAAMPEFNSNISSRVLEVRKDGGPVVLWSSGPVVQKGGGPVVPWSGGPEVRRRGTTGDGKSK